MTVKYECEKTLTTLECAAERDQLRTLTIPGKSDRGAERNEMASSRRNGRLRSL